MQKLYPDNSFAFEICQQCQAVIHEYDRFCRHCGIDLGGECAAPLATANLRIRQITTELRNGSSAYATVPFTGLDGRRPISGPLVKLMTTELTLPNRTQVARSVMLILIAFPIWLMMVLLSPLDAYAAVKAINRQI